MCARRPDPMTTEGLARVIAVVEEASEAILAIYAGAFDVDMKADRSPVTSADRAAHDVIVAGLRDWWPDVPIISEEGELPDAAERRSWTRYWLVDPLDGTKEFISRNGEFTVNIALMERGEPVLGVVAAPAIEVLYWAARGLGAWRRIGSGEPERIRSRVADVSQPLVVVESRSHP